MGKSSYFLRYILVLTTISITIVAFSWLIHNNNSQSNSAPTSIGLTSTIPPAMQHDFVMRKGSSLILDGKLFRFAGANIYWLGLQETDTGVSYPSHFRVDDALATASFMGETVVRAHTLGISVGCLLCIEPSLGKFNQMALQHIDYAVWSAKIHHIKLIIPLVDNWHYYHGGKQNFTLWYNISNINAFYYSSPVISIFKQYIHVILNHVNSYTGVAYKDDPTILAWETGNELSAPSDWVRDISAYIKDIDPYHLVMDGNYEQADQTSNFLPDLSIKSIDIYTGHFYPPNITTLHTELNQVLSAKKVFIVGEYDWNTNNGDKLSNFLSIIEHSKIAGDMYWSLFPHNDNYGFVSQEEHFTLHYPGDTSDMRSRISLLRAHAFAMRGLHLATAAIPGKPKITAINGYSIAWRGAFGAATYSIERSTHGSDGPWVVICNRCTTDQNSPLKNNNQLIIGTAAYRIKGYSISGVPGPYSAIYWFTR